MVEVVQRQGTGYDYSWYPATIVALLPNGRLRVTIARASDPPSDEDILVSRCRPVPPLLEGPSLITERQLHLGSCEVGDVLEMFYLGGWWQVAHSYRIAIG